MQEESNKEIVQSISTKITERAVKKLVIALRKLTTELVWKPPGKEYHRKCRVGSPGVCWLAETLKQVWEKETLWRKIPNNYMLIGFNYKLTAHANIINKRSP